MNFHPKRHGQDEGDLQKKYRSKEENLNKSVLFVSLVSCLFLISTSVIFNVGGLLTLFYRGTKTYHVYTSFYNISYFKLVYTSWIIIVCFILLIISMFMIYVVIFLFQNCFDLYIQVLFITL